MFKRWHYQNLEGERLHYITEWDHEDGIIGEHFFEYHEYGDMIKFCIDNNISFEEISLPIHSEVKDQSEWFASKYRLANVDFQCLIRMYGGDDKVFKSQYKITLDMIEQLPPETIGHILKEMLEELKKYVKKHE